MSMEENDHNIPPQVRELFHDFEAEPPPQSWDLIRARLTGEQSGTHSPLNWSHLVGWFQPMNRLYPVLTVAGLVLIALFIWLGSKPSNQIKGQAMADQAKLTRGTAYLFRTHDRVSPYDSVRFFGKKELDSTGHFAFHRIPSGSYLLRIHVHPDSPHYPKYKHGYYGEQLQWNQATLIHTDHPQENYPVRVPKLTSK